MDTAKAVSSEVLAAQRALVIIIVPSHNYAHFIGQTLDSVRAQSYQNWECIIVDDGSTDNTREIITPYLAIDSRFKYIFQNNQGLSAARNTGLAQCRGTYLQFLDSDDLIEPQKIERQVEYLEQHPEVDIVYGKSRSFCEADIGDRPYACWGDEMQRPFISCEGREGLLSLIRFAFPVHSALLRKTVVDDVGNFNIHSKACGDMLFWICCCLHEKVIQYKEIVGTLALYRRHQSSMCASRLSFLKEVRKARNVIWAIVKDPEALELNQQFATEIEGLLGIDRVVNGRRAHGAWHFCRAVFMTNKWREKAKLFFCALAALLAPRSQISRIVVTPVRQWVVLILRRA